METPEDRHDSAADSALVTVCVFVIAIMALAGALAIINPPETTCASPAEETPQETTALRGKEVYNL